LPDPQDLDRFEHRALKNLANGEWRMANGEGAYLADFVVQRLISLSLATRATDGKIYASELARDIVLQSRPLR